MNIYEIKYILKTHSLPQMFIFIEKFQIFTASKINRKLDILTILLILNHLVDFDVISDYIQFNYIYCLTLTKSTNSLGI